MKKFKYLLLLIPLLFTTKVNALTFDTFDVTWYYRNKSNENNLLNVVKGQDTALYASTSEYVNGYTTRIENTFTKDIQYIINYELKMWFSPEQELNYRSDTLQRIIDYSYTDIDFKILNVTATENWNRSSSIGDTVLTINVSMQILALNNTNAIRFGVYTTNNISIGFYNHTDQIDYYLVNNISIEENANATIIDQNNQIINGQNGINNNITNSTNIITGSITETEDNLNSSIQSSQDNINQNIDDMQNAIVDSNKETQDVIKDQFNTCRPSNNIINIIDTVTSTQGLNVTIENGVITLSGTSTNDGAVGLGTYTLEPGTYYQKLNYSSGASTYSLIRNIVDGSVLKVGDGSFTITETTQIIFQLYFNNKFNGTYTYKPMLNKGNTPLSWEPGGEICSNKIDETNNQLNDLNNNLNNSDSTGATNDASNFFSNFTTDTFGLTSIITAPLSLINTITSSSCSTLRLPLPYLDNKYLELPCMNTIYTEYFGSFFNIYQTITFGIIAYWVIVRIFNQVKDFKNPDHDEIEVLDL